MARTGFARRCSAGDDRRGIDWCRKATIGGATQAWSAVATRRYEPSIVATQATLGHVRLGHARLGQARQRGKEGMASAIPTALASLAALA